MLGDLQQFDGVGRASAVQLINGHNQRQVTVRLRKFSGHILKNVSELFDRCACFRMMGQFFLSEGRSGFGKLRADDRDL